MKKNVDDFLNLASLIAEKQGKKREDFSIEDAFQALWTVRNKYSTKAVVACHDKVTPTFKKVKDKFLNLFPFKKKEKKEPPKESSLTKKVKSALAKSFIHSFTEELYKESPPLKKEIKISFITKKKPNFQKDLQRVSSSLKYTNINDLGNYLLKIADDIARENDRKKENILLEEAFQAMWKMRRRIPKFLRDVKLSLALRVSKFVFRFLDFFAGFKLILIVLFDFSNIFGLILGLTWLFARYPPINSRKRFQSAILVMIALPFIKDIYQGREIKKELKKAV